VLTSLENVGENLAGGLELVAAGRLLPQLDYNFSGNVYYNEIDAGNLGFAGTRSAYSYEAKAALNWRASGRDTLQVNLGSLGKRLTPQGYRGGSTTLDLGFRHRLRPNFSVTATVSDIFESRGNRFVTDTGELSETTSLRLPGRIFYVGLSWSLTGTKQNTPDDLEYE
jgi:outer membrane receptor for ferrienterochelin and colicin